MICIYEWVNHFLWYKWICHLYAIKCNARRLWIWMFYLKVTCWAVFMNVLHYVFWETTKKEITIAGFVGPFRMSHLPVGVIYLKGKSKRSNMFYNVHISIYNKWLEEKKKARILLFIFSEEWEMEKSLSLIQMKGVNQRIIVGATVAFLMLNVKISL